MESYRVGIQCIEGDIIVVISDISTYSLIVEDGVNAGEIASASGKPTGRLCLGFYLLQNPAQNASETANSCSPSTTKFSL